MNRQTPNQSCNSFKRYTLSQKYRIFVFLLGLFCILAAIPGTFYPEAAFAQEPTAVRMIPGTIEVGPVIENAILEALIKGDSILPEVDYYAVTRFC